MSDSHIILGVRCDIAEQDVRAVVPITANVGDIVRAACDEAGIDYDQHYKLQVPYGTDKGATQHTLVDDDDHALDALRGCEKRPKIVKTDTVDSPFDS